VQAELEESRALHHYTKAQKNGKFSSDGGPLRVVMTTAGSYRLAVKRNLSHTGQAAMATTLDANVGRWAVSRAELLLGIYFERAAIAWYDSMHAAMKAMLMQCDCCCSAPSVVASCRLAARTYLVSRCVKLVQVAYAADSRCPLPLDLGSRLLASIVCRRRYFLLI
jgi:hypothetical protein